MLFCTLQHGARVLKWQTEKSRFLFNHTIEKLEGHCAEKQINKKNRKITKRSDDLPSSYNCSQFVKWRFGKTRLTLERHPYFLYTKIRHFDYDLF